MRTRERIVREDEQRYPVRFQSACARWQFQKYALDKDARQKNGANAKFVVPFVVRVSDSSKLSENAYYNDQVVSCDANRDGLLSDDEVAEYSYWMAQNTKPSDDESTVHATDAKEPPQQIGSREPPPRRR